MKKDVRIIQTKKKLSKALGQLLETKALDDISVIDLVTKANINRSTFYLHYVSINDFYAELQQSIYDELNEELINYVHHDTGWINQYLNPYSQNEVEVTILKYILQFLYDNKQIQAIVKARRYNSEFLLKIVSEGYISALEMVLSYQPDLDRGKFKSIYTFVAMGTIGLIFDWIENDTKESVESITRICNDFIIHTLRIQFKD